MLKSDWVPKSSASLILLALVAGPLQSGPAAGEHSARPTAAGLARVAWVAASGICKATTDVARYLATDTVIDAQKYGGGLTTEATARSWIGQKVVLSEDTFSARGQSINRPTYQLACHRMPEAEGECPSIAGAISMASEPAAAS